MASTTRGGGFARAGETEPGYKRSEVDRLFTRLAEDYEKLSGASELPEDLYTSRRIRQVVFREEPGGYQLDVVDRALEKIEVLWQTGMQISLDIQRQLLMAWFSAVTKL